jgi:hypothetical protein
LELVGPVGEPCIEDDSSFPLHAASSTIAAAINN